MIRRLLLIALIVAGLYWGAKPLGMRVACWIYPFPYREVVEREAARYRLDPLLVVAVMRVESGFAADARSGAGARGLMQLMPATAEWAAKKAGVRGYAVERLEDPALNIRLGCWYLGYLQRYFKGELPLVLAAYNAGQGNVGRWQREPDTLKAAYPETRRYVERSLKTYRIYQTLYRGGV